MWCTPGTFEDRWMCDNPAFVGGKSYSRTNIIGGVQEICPGWCDTATNTCIPWVCDKNAISDRRCDPYGQVRNGCGELVEDCVSFGKTCVADANSQTCGCVQVDFDACPNIVWLQFSIPAWYRKDAAGNCVMWSVDVCPNIVGDQSTIPAWYRKDAAGNCVPNIEANCNLKITKKTLKAWETTDIYCESADGGYNTVMFINGVNVWSNRYIFDSKNYKQWSYPIRCVNTAGWWWKECTDTIGVETLNPTCNVVVQKAKSAPNESNKIECISNNRYGQAMYIFTGTSTTGAWRWTALNVGRIFDPALVTTTLYRDGALGRSRYEFGGKPLNPWIYTAFCVTTDNINNDVWSTKWYECSAQFEIVESSPNQADVMITKTVDKPIFPNVTWELITWTLNYKNNGPLTATGVVVTDQLPSGLTYVSSIPTATVSQSGLLWNVGTLQPGQTWLITIVSRYAGGRPNDIPLTNNTSIRTSTTEVTYANNTSSDVTKPTIPIEPTLVSCEDSTITQTPTATGARIDYVCAHAGGTSGRLDVYSGAVKLYTVNGFNGSVTVPYGTYTAQCVIDGTVTYKVTKYVFGVPQSCPYKKHTTTNIVCAVQANLAPSAVAPLNPSLVIGSLNPIPYCSVTQLADTNYVCQSTVAGDTIYVRDDMACTELVTVSLPTAKLGDRVWHDADKDGIQDAGEVGIAGTKVSLYACGGTTVLKTTTTDSNGKYLFDQLGSWSYKVVFDMPAWYTTFTSKWVWSTATDSNANAVGSTDCINLAWGETNLTIDAGVYKGGSCSDCGWNNLCGNGVVELSWKDTIFGNADDEECDDGNQVSGDKCSRSCKKEWFGGWGGWCTRCGWGSSNTTRKITKNETGWYIDPPDAMVGEYVPFRWWFDKASDIEFTEDCNSLVTYKPAVTYVVNSRDDKGAICEFYLRDGKNNKSRVINHYCDERRDLESWNLFNTYFDGVSNAISTNYNGSDGASFISPLNWKTNNGWQFEYLGEYNLVWNKTTYYTCDAVFKDVTTWTDTNGDWVKDTNVTTSEFDGYKLSNEWISDMDIIMPLTVTKPYMTQQNGLSASAEDRDIMNKILTISWNPITTSSATTVSNTSFAGSENLKYLVDTFVQKYRKFATNDVRPTRLRAWLAKKVASDNIYVLSAGSEIGDHASLWNTTIIVPEGSVTVVGNISKNVMILAPKWDIMIEPSPVVDTFSQPSNQTLKGIYIAQQIKSDYIRNDVLTKSWKFGWQLKIDGLIYNLTNATTAIASLKNSRRSTLRDWFDSTVSRVSMVQKGSSLQLATDPSLWTSLPPGANELMKELEAFK
jgi:uncharacterized repeat protein (TIGR01451 family)